MTAIIHHNPQCGTSRNAHKMIEASGEEVRVIEYLDTGWSRAQLLAPPILVNRPIVVTPKGIRRCRPSEAVIELLENPHFGVFTKEDGEQIDTGRA